MRDASPYLDSTAMSDPGPSTGPPEPPHREITPIPRKRMVPYVEIPHRPAWMRKATQIHEAVSTTHADDIPSSSTHPSRGLTLAQRVIAFPSPPPSDDDWVKGRAAHRQDEQLSLSEALNRSFATGSALAESGIDSTPGSRREIPKRKSGRSRSRGRGLAATASIANDNESPSRRLPKASGSDTLSASAPPVKRGPGRPRKHPLPGSATEPRPISVSGPRRSSARSKSRTRAVRSPTDEDEGDAAAVVDQLLQDASSSPRVTSNVSPTRHDYAHHTVDASPIARGFARQAQDEAAHATDWDATSPPRRPRGRPPGSKNKGSFTRATEALPKPFVLLPPRSPRDARTRAAPSVAESTISSLPPVPIKRSRGRPRKSAPSEFPPSDFVDYIEPLRDPDDDALTAGPPVTRARSRGRSRTRRNSTSALPDRAPAGRAPSPPAPRTRSRGRSSTRRNSISAVPDSASADPATSSQYYLDLDTMQWKRRTRSVSASPAKRRRSSSRSTRARKPIEYPTSKAIFSALKITLVAASMKPKLTQAMTDDGLRIAPSGVLLLSNGTNDEPADATTSVFNGSWAVLEDPRVIVDDALVMKRLHEVVIGVGGFIRFEQAHISRTSGGRIVTVTVPCCCQSVQPENPEHPAWAARAATTQTVECEGELAVSVGEQPTREFAGLAKVLRTTVTVTH
ncbi:hypothetical protein ACG7TL_007987 [Trametes sanguinea]